MHRCVCLAALYAALLGALLPLRSGAQLPTGSLRGTTQDASGARVAGAAVHMSNPEQSLSREGVSDSRGEFRIDDLAPGSYQVTVSARNLADAHSIVRIAVSSVREISVILQPKTVTETVLVTAPQSITAEQLETASATHQAIIYRQDLAGIPLAARSFANISYLAPEPNPSSLPTRPRRASRRSRPEAVRD